MVKIIKKILDVLFIIIIILLATYFILRATDRIKIYSVKTGSMEENIHVGDYILILRKNCYHVGEIVTFEQENYYVTHRIIRKEGSSITTKGDANNTEDDEIDESVIVGKVILVGGMLNYIINYKYSLAGTLLAIYLLSCYFGKERPKNTKEETIENKEKIVENKEKIVENKEKIDNIQIKNEKEKTEEKNIKEEKSNIKKSSTKRKK